MDLPLKIWWSMNDGSVLLRPLWPGSMPMTFPASGFEPPRVRRLAEADLASPEGAVDGCLVDVAEGWPMTEHAAPPRLTAMPATTTAATRQGRLVSDPAASSRPLSGPHI